MSRLTISFFDSLFCFLEWFTSPRWMKTVVGLALFLGMDSMEFSSLSLIITSWVQVDQILSVTRFLNPPVLTCTSFTKQWCRVLEPCTCWASTLLLNYIPSPLTLHIKGADFETIISILGTRLHHVHPSKPDQKTVYLTPGMWTDWHPHRPSHLQTGSHTDVCNLIPSE